MVGTGLSVEPGVHSLHRTLLSVFIVVGAIVLALIRREIGRLTLRKSQRVPNKVATTPEQRFGLLLGAVYTETEKLLLARDIDPAASPRGADLFFCLDQGQTVASEKEMLQSWWDIVDTPTARHQLQRLFEGGRRKPYASRLAWLQERSLLDASPEQVEQAFQSVTSDEADSNPQEALQAMLWVRRNWKRVGRGGVAAFDIARIILLARATLAAGYVAEDEAWQAVARAVSLARGAYDSWAEFGAGFLVSRESWAGSPSLKFDQVVERLLRHPSSPWARVEWPRPLPASGGPLLH